MMSASDSLQQYSYYTHCTTHTTYRARRRGGAVRALFRDDSRGRGGGALRQMRPANRNVLGNGKVESSSSREDTGSELS